MTDCTEPCCVECGLSHGKLLPIKGTEDVIHEHCAQRSEDYGLCQYCSFNREDVAYLGSELTNQGECSVHSGESASSGPDVDDITENIINNS